MPQDKGKGSLGKYGPEAIGEEKFKAEQEKLKGSKWKYGSDVTGEEPPAPAVKPPTAAPPSVPIGPKVVAAEPEADNTKGKKK